MSHNLLLVKSSSLGDVVHTLPVIHDLQRACPDLTIDWLVERAYAEIPGWHPGVRRVIPVQLRRWRRRPLRSLICDEIQHFFRQVRSTSYSHIVDAQGLLKSALLSCCARGGRRYGPDAHWAREPLAAYCYHHPIAATVVTGYHAIDRLRQLFAAVFDYPLPTDAPQFGIDRQRLPPLPQPLSNYWVLLHGTTWPSKLWPEPHWIQLGQLAVQQGVSRLLLPWWTQAERERAERLAAAIGPAAQVLSRCPVGVIAAYLAAADRVVGVDSGLSHLAAALDVPGVTLFGATDARRLGVWRPRNQPLAATGYPCSPCHARRCSLPAVAGIYPACYHDLSPEQVFQAVNAVAT
ncbi:MAG: lipopolysaccharide heptosyltransferase I [Magnetococcales bacterium]|nr:lipopolysaccharide heptosyltransferase I [Magnetococcales bacterium]